MMYLSFMAGMIGAIRSNEELNQDNFTIYGGSTRIWFNFKPYAFLMRDEVMANGKKITFGNRVTKLLSLASSSNQPDVSSPYITP